LLNVAKMGFSVMCGVSLWRRRTSNLKKNHNNISV